jgi:cell division ATPase FtsA
VTDPVATLALCKWLRDRIRAWEAQAKADLSMTAGERKAAAIGGAHLGFVTLARGKRSTDVDDEALAEWVEQRWPSEIVKTVRPAFRKKLLDQALNRGAVIDGDGVVCDAVTVSHGDPYPTTQLDAEADIAISVLLSQGRIGIDGLKELTP